MENKDVIDEIRVNPGRVRLAVQEKLRIFGFTKNESKIFVFLSRNGPTKASDISKEEKIPRTETYHLLTNLKNKGVIKPSIQRPTKFLAVPIEKAVESLINIQKKKIEELSLQKNELIELWNLLQNINNYSKTEYTKIEKAMEKYAKSLRFRQDFKRNLKKIRQKSETSNKIK